LKSTHSELALECEGISKYYRIGEVTSIFTLTDYVASCFNKNSRQPRKNDFWALQNVSFELKHGQALGIIGRNGAGKSTLLKILSRITHPTHGRFGFNGTMASLLEVGTGFKQELSGKDNIFLSGSVMGLSRHQIKAVYDEIVEFSEIGTFIDTPVKRYSSGMYVRLAFAVAAHLDPDILIIDEVLAVGDLKFQKKCLQKMNMATKAGKTIIFVSHQIEAMTQLCNSVLYLEKGQVVEKGPTLEVIQTYQRNMMKDFSKEEQLLFELNPEKEACVRAISIRSAITAKPSHHYDICESIELTINFELLRHFSDLKVIVFIYQLGGPVIWSSFSTDWHNFNEKEPLLITPKEKGDHQIKVVIPAPVLNTGQYEVEVGLGLNLEQIFDLQRGLYFNVTDLKNSYSSLVTSTRAAGQIVTPMQWN